MAEDLTIQKDAALRKDAEPPNPMGVSEDLTLPDGRPAPLTVECNVAVRCQFLSRQQKLFWRLATCSPSR